MDNDTSVTRVSKPQCVVCSSHLHDPGEPCSRRCRRADVVETLLICRPCYERTERHLRDIPELYALAADEMLPGTGGGSRSTEPSLGLRVAALDLRTGGEVLERLATWERDVRETFGLDPVHAGAYLRGSTSGRLQALDRYGRGRTEPTTMTLTGVVAFLLEQLHAIAGAHYAVDDFAHDIAEIHRVAVHAARTAQRPGWYVDCPADHLDGVCGRRLRVTGEDYGSTVTCGRCRTVWDVTRLLRVVSSTEGADVWLAADDVAELIGLNERTVRKMAARGLVERRGGRYRLSDVRSAILASSRAQEA